MTAWLLKRKLFPRSSPLLESAGLDAESAFVAEFALPPQVFRTQKLFQDMKGSLQTASPHVPCQPHYCAEGCECVHSKDTFRRQLRFHIVKIR